MPRAEDETGADKEADKPAEQENAQNANPEEAAQNDDGEINNLEDGEKAQ